MRSPSRRPPFETPARPSRAPQGPLVPRGLLRDRSSANVRRATALLKGGVVGGHVAALVVVGAFLATRGPASAASAAVAAAVTLAFYTGGLAVQVMVADAPATKVLFASLASYGLRVTALGLALALSLGNAHLVAGMDPVAVVVATVAVVIGWLAAEIWVHSRLRIPLYDPPEAEDARPPGRM